MAKKQSKTTKKSITLIKKSNDLIESRYKFDIWETRFFLSVLSKIRREDKEFQQYRIRYKDVIKTFGLKATSSYDLLRKAATSLMKQTVMIDYEENGVKRQKIYHLIRQVDILKEGQGLSASKQERQEYIDVVVESQMRPFLLELQRNFTAYDLRNVVNLSVYPIRIYELLKQYESIGHRLLYIDEMKKMFELEKEYPMFSNFYQKVIHPAIEEINKHTDIKILNIEKYKEGKKVIGLEFYFKRKSDDEIQHLREELNIQPKKELTLFQYADETEEIEYEEIPETKEAPNHAEKDKLFMQFQQVVVQEFGVSPTVFITELGNHTELQINQAIRVTQRAIKEGKAKNSAAFFIDALRKGFTDPQEEKAKKRVVEDEKKVHNEKIEKTIKEIEEIKNQALNDKIRALTTVNPKITDEAIEALKEDEIFKKAILRKEKSLGRELVIEDFREDVMLRGGVKNQIMKQYESDFILISDSYDKQINDLKKQLLK